MAELATVARPYAEAAFRIGLEGRNLAQWSGMLELVDAVVGDEQFSKYIGDPNTHEGALEALILGALGERLDGKGRNFVQVLVQNRRLELAPHILSLFEDLRREHEGTVEAKVVSALPITDDQLKPLVAALEAKYGKKVSAQVEVDPELIGGARIVIGDKVIDATVRGRLDAMATALAH